MHSFKDSANRDWIVSLNVDAIKRVKALLQIDLTKPTEGDPPLLIRLGIDVILLCDVLYAVCKPDCDQRSITDEQFGQAMGATPSCTASGPCWGNWPIFSTGSAIARSS